MFGCHHAPPGGAPRRGALVLCHPFGSEYLRAHRLMRELAGRLAQAGFHVLRFDYSGTGDSAGESEDAELPRWLDDIESAAEEARELSGSSTLSLVGLRLGASLAALWGSRGGEPRQVVLWGPVVSGADYLRELAEQHRAWFEVRPRPSDFALSDPPCELLGAPLGAGLRQAIADLDLQRLPRCPARRVLVIGPHESGPLGALRERLAGLGCPPDSLDQLASSWTLGDFDQQPVPAQTLQGIVGWLTQTPA